MKVSSLALARIKMADCKMHMEEAMQSMGKM